MGEAKRRLNLSQHEVLEAPGLSTASGRLQVRWDPTTQATPLGQMAFFIEFLLSSGVFDRWVQDCPLAYRSPNGSSVRDILGTWLLSILSGHWRYAHISAIRSDGVNPALLGMTGLVSEDSVRRALKALDEGGGTAWLKRHIEQSVKPLLYAPWVLDVDVTVKPLYGKQEGAVIGFNPRKPGRPSHAYHSYQVSGLRLLFGVDVLAGNHTAMNHTLPGLLEVIDGLPAEKRPKLVRGDSGLGGEAMLSALEARGIPYLFKLRQTKNVKKHIEREFWHPRWERANQGWEGREGTIQLSGWSRPRRVVVLRRALREEGLALADPQQMLLAFIEPQRALRGYEYAVLVTDLPLEVLAIAQLYRDRADSENTFDELKNQWGWCGFTTRDLKRCRFSALAVQLIYNWWSLYVRLGNPKARREAITSRPLLLSGVARRTTHAGGQQLVITPQHADAAQAQGILTRIHRLLEGFRATAEQLRTTSVWQLICDHIVATVARLRAAAVPILAPPAPA